MTSIFIIIQIPSKTNSQDWSTLGTLASALCQALTLESPTLCHIGKLNLSADLVYNCEKKIIPTLHSNIVFV